MDKSINLQVEQPHTGVLQSALQSDVMSKGITDCNTNQNSQPQILQPQLQQQLQASMQPQFMMPMVNKSHSQNQQMMLSQYLPITSMVGGNNYLANLQNGIFTNTLPMNTKLDIDSSTTQKVENISYHQAAPYLNQVQALSQYPMLPNGVPMLPFGGAMPLKPDYSFLPMKPQTLATTVGLHSHAQALAKLGMPGKPKHTKRLRMEWSKSDVIVLLVAAKHMTRCELKDIVKVVYTYTKRIPGKSCGRAGEKKLKRLVEFKNWKMCDKEKVVTRITKLLKEMGEDPDKDLDPKLQDLINIYNAKYQKA